jgi:hypothetical protein
MLGIPAIIILIYILSDTDHVDNCKHNYVVANVVEFINYALMIAFIIYAVRKIGEGYYRAFEKYENPDSIFSEVGRFLCYDFIVLFFIVFAIWTFVFDIVVLVWTGDEYKYCEDEHDGILTATNFMAGWHIAMLFFGLFLFIFALCLLTCAENSLAKPFVICCLCGYEDIEREKRRRRQKALENQQKMQNDRHQEQFKSPVQPGGYTSNGQPQHQSNQSPAYNSYQANQQNPNPGYNPYPPSPQPNYSESPAKSPAAPIEKPETKKGFLARAKDKVKEYTDKL